MHAAGGSGIALFIQNYIYKNLYSLFLVKVTPAKDTRGLRKGSSQKFLGRCNFS
jgi:hypothetical protein